MCKKARVVIFRSCSPAARKLLLVNGAFWNSKHRAWQLPGWYWESNQCRAKQALAVLVYRLRDLGAVVEYVL